MTTPKIITIGFDGPNRVGKGTQCHNLQRWLSSNNVPSLIVRGAGSRTGLGNQPGDPLSSWWQEVNQWLRTPEATFEDWDITSARLARELIVWRGRILPNCAKESGCPAAVLIVDRTLISRTMTLRARGIKEVASNLYPVQAFGYKRKISPEVICPDIIFNLTAPKDTLLARLSPLDPKYEFRKQLIESTAGWFSDAAHFIPKQLQNRVVEIDAAKSEAVIFETIRQKVQNHFPALKPQTETGGITVVV